MFKGSVYKLCGLLVLLLGSAALITLGILSGKFFMLLLGFALLVWGIAGLFRFHFQSIPCHKAPCEPLLLMQLTCPFPLSVGYLFFLDCCLQHHPCLLVRQSLNLTATDLFPPDIPSGQSIRLRRCQHFPHLPLPGLFLV